VAAVYTAEEILEIAGGRLAAGNIGPETGAISTDTRQIKEGDWFVALEGRRYNGHDFLGDAFSNGAIGAIVSERTGYAIASHSFPLIAVEAPGKALSCLARNWRRRLNPQVIVLCGDGDELVNLIRVVATGQRLKVTCLNRCAKAKEAAELVLDMPEDNKLIVVGLSPCDLNEVENAAIALEPNILSFLPMAFDNLRLTSDPLDLKAAKISLTRNLNRMWAWILSSEGSDESMPGDSTATLLTCPQKFFEEPKWQKRPNAFGPSLAEDYEQALSALSVRLNHGRAWLCTTACALAGIAPGRLID
jgi:UDP-N-acetylmuramoyl-tripeptide--D-alanyl-D-alanine ligase